MTIKQNFKQYHQLLNEQQIFLSANEIQQSTIYRFTDDYETVKCQSVEEY